MNIDIEALNVDQDSPEGKHKTRLLIADKDF